MGRRTGEQTKALLLRAGMQMLLERGMSAGVQHIRLQDVLRRTGLTTGAAYRLWADQSDYHRDLAVAMMRMRVVGPADTMQAAIVDLIESGASGEDVINAAALAHVRTANLDMSDPTDLLDAQSFLIALALRTTADTWPELTEASHERHRESVAAFSELYRRLMDAYGMRMREGLTLEDFSEALAAIAEGFAIRALEGLEHPTYRLDGADGLPTGEWTLLGLSVRALVFGFMAQDTPAPNDD
jgi:AcrR family transcriptional regulator